MSNASSFNDFFKHQNWIVEIWSKDSWYWDCFDFCFDWFFDFIIDFETDFAAIERSKSHDRNFEILYKDFEIVILQYLLSHSFLLETIFWSTIKSVSSLILFSETINDFEVKSGQKLWSTSLTTIKKFIKHEVFQILVICNYFNGKSRFF